MWRLFSSKRLGPHHRVWQCWGWSLQGSMNPGIPSLPVWLLLVIHSQWENENFVNRLLCFSDCIFLSFKNKDYANALPKIKNTKILSLPNMLKLLNVSQQRLARILVLDWLTPNLTGNTHISIKIFQPRGCFLSSKYLALASALTTIKALLFSSSGSWIFSLFGFLTVMFADLFWMFVIDLLYVSY